MNLELQKAFEHTYVRGEIEALTWCSTMRSISIEERRHIVDRITKLRKFLKGEIPADRDGTKAQWVPDFQEGSKPGSAK